MADYAKLIDKQLVNALKKLSSLTKPVTFHLKGAGEFDFGQGAPVEPTSADVSTRALILETKQKGEVITKRLLVDSIGELDTFDEVTLENQRWKLGPSILDNGHTQIIEVYRG